MDHQAIHSGQLEDTGSWIPREGWMADVERQRKGGGYVYPTPTETGWERLEEERLFG